MKHIRDRLYIGSSAICITRIENTIPYLDTYPYIKKEVFDRLEAILYWNVLTNINDRLKYELWH